MSAMNKKLGVKFFDEEVIAVTQTPTIVLDQAVGGSDVTECEILNVDAVLASFKIYGKHH